MLEFCSGLPPFLGLPDQDCLRAINEKESPLDSYLGRERKGDSLVDVVTELRDLLRECFKADYKERPSAKQLL